jgi:hypothetical protein
MRTAECVCLVAFTDEDVDVREFDDLRTAIDAAETEITQQDRLDARSQHTTKGREAAADALVDWMVEMQGHARILLRGKAQLLEMLGIPRRR